MFFDYATLYRQKHAQIASADQFKLTDADIEDFCKFLENKEFKYETEAGRYFTELIDLATQEHVDSATIAELKAMQPKLTLDLRTAIDRCRTDIEKFLGSEIIKRYYYQKGYNAYTLRFDSEVKRAAEEIKNIIQ